MRPQDLRNLYEEDRGIQRLTIKRTSADHALWHLGRYALFRNFIQHHKMLSWFPTSRRPL